eukprot:124206-Hanusia_phi.AAC.1
MMRRLQQIAVMQLRRASSMRSVPCFSGPCAPDSLPSSFCTSVTPQTAGGTLSPVPYPPSTLLSPPAPAPAVPQLGAPAATPAAIAPLARASSLPVLHSCPPAAVFQLGCGEVEGSRGPAPVRHCPATPQPPANWSSSSAGVRATDPGALRREQVQTTVSERRVVKEEGNGVQLEARPGQSEHEKSEK